MDVVSYILSTTFTKQALRGVGFIKGSPCVIQSIVDNLDGTHDITFSWKDNTDVTHTSVLTVKDGETPAFSSVAITGGHRLTFTTQDPAQSVSFNVMDGAKGDTGISVVASNVDENNNLTLTLSNGNVINAGKIKAVTTVDNALSTTSSNPVENKVITDALNNKVDKEMGKGLFSDEEKAKLNNIEDGAQVNVLEKLIINGQEATITDKSIALTLITSAVSNLQNYYLKTETYTKQEVEDLIGSTVGVTIEIVEQLPTEGQSNVIYFLPTETEGVYSQYIYSNNSWILIGSTTVDLSNYYTKAQVDTLLNGKQNVLTIDSFPTPLSNNPVASGGVYTAIAQMQPQFQFANMPTASSTNLGFVYQYTGVTGTYTQNMFYRCIYDDVLGEYRWEEVIFHATVTVDSAISGTSTNPVQNKVIKEALDTKQDVMQYSTMPSAQDNLGKIVQYIGTNTSNYTNGYFYKAVYDSESDVYLWTVIKFSADMLVDNALSTTSENPVQNKVITAKINGIEAVIPSEASDTNQLVDRDSLGTASQKNFTPYVSPDNTDVPLSSSVYSAITSAVYGAYHPSGSKTIAELTSDLLVFANIGNVYKITEDGVTTNLFVGGAGQTIHTGDNAVVVYGGQPNTFLFDLQSGSIDLTPYQTKALASAIEGATTVEGALGALSANKQAKTLTTSVESQTTVEGALGALSTNKATQAEVNDMNNVLGAKNLLPNNATSQTINGVTFTVNTDGSITVNGTASATLALEINQEIPLDSSKSYILNGCADGGEWEGYRLDVYEHSNGLGFIGVQTTEELIISNKSSAVVRIRIARSTVISNKTFKPMLRLASDPDNTYVPYAPTNAKLNEEKMSYADNGVLGAVNMLSNIATTQTINGVTFTVNSDGTVTANGTATANAVLKISDRFTLADYIGRKYVDAKKNEASSSTYSLIITYRNGSGTYVNETYVPTEGFILSTISNATLVEFGIFVKSGQSVSNLTFKPMITVPSYNGGYVPYAMTNKELTDVIPSDASILNKLVAESEFKSYGIKTIWTGSKTKGDTGMNFDASPYDLCFAQVGGTWCRLITGVGGGSTTRKKFSALYAGRDYVNANTYEQYYLLDIVPDGTIATCGWFDIASKNTQNARLAGQKALELATAGTSTWTDPTWKKLSDVESSVTVSKIIGIKFQTKS